MSTLQEKAVGCQGPAVPVQAVLPGCEAFFRPAELSRGAQRLLRILRWFRRKLKEIRVSQRWLADRLGVSVRSVSRWFAELRKAGAEVLEWRGPNPPLVSVDGVAFGVAFSVPISITQSSHPSFDKPKARSLPEYVCEAITRATARIKAARNPAAYRQTIISTELRLGRREPAKKKPAALEERLDPRTQHQLDTIGCRRFGSWLMNSSAS